MDTAPCGSCKTWLEIMHIERSRSRDYGVYQELTLQLIDIETLVHYRVATLEG